MRATTDPLIANGWGLRPKSRVKNDIRSLVRAYLRATDSVPYRAVDCDQDFVLDLRAKLARLVDEK